MSPDQDALSCIINMMDATGKLVKWQLCLPVLKFQVVPETGLKKKVAITLFWLTKMGTDNTPLCHGQLRVTRFTN